MQCLIFRCAKKQEMYLYVPFQDDEQAAIELLPEGLLKMTGRLEKVMQLNLTPERSLARADRNEVVAALNDKGFYLQMPPADVLLQDSSSLDDRSDTF